MVVSKILTSNKILLIGFAYFSFVVVGMSASLLGVGWPSIQTTFEVPLDAVGVLLFAGTSGHLLASFGTGRIASRLGVGLLLLLSAMIATVGLIGQALAPLWPWLVLFSFVGGMGIGGLDTGMNIYMATNHGVQVMNWLHASFGLGATIGPLMMTAVITSDLGWRYGFGLVGCIYVCLAFFFAMTLSRWRYTKQATQAEVVLPASYGRTLSQLTVWVSILIFFIYGGIEVTAGQWSFALFTEARHIAVDTAGIWVSIYWGSLTVGRLLFGFVIERFGLVRFLRLCHIGIIVGSLLIAIQLPFFGYIGLVLLGLSLAPIFPSLISATPERLGEEHAPNAIGFQVGAAGFGIAVLPSLAGVLADSISLEIIGPYMVIFGLLMWGLYERLISSTM